MDDHAALIRAGRKRLLYVPDPADRVELLRADVERLIPHRAPFRFVDRIDAIRGDAIAGRYRLADDDPVFRGHFPGDPIFPGALQVEAIGQLGLCLFAHAQGRTGQVRALKIHHAAFLAAIRPGSELALVATALGADSYTATCAGQVAVAGTICCIAIMEVYFGET